MITQGTSIYPDPPHPYYVVTPPYSVASAGIRCLHLLCHSLNLNDQTAYVVSDPLNITYPLRTGSDFITPHLTADIARDHFDRGKCPIVVYPESVTGNPYAAGCVVRYVLNFPGVLGGDASYGDSELVFAFSKALAESCAAPSNVLHFPLIDTRIFRLPPPGTVRRGSCFYAAKFRGVHGGVPGEITKDSIEITRHEADSQSPGEIARLLQSSEIFYTYENTAMAIEAVLCGCPAVFIPNPYLDKIIASDELGRDGFAWGTDPDEVARAKDSVAQGISNYQASVAEFQKQLDHFIVVTQAHVRARGTLMKLNIPSLHFVTYDSLFKAVYMELSRRLPVAVEREIAKLLSTCGFKSIGSTIWDNAVERASAKLMLRIKTRGS